MTLTEAREWVRQFGRDTAGSSTAYSDTMVDRAIIVVGEDFIEHTHVTRTVNELTLTASDDDLPSFPSGFRPEQFLRAWIPAKHAVTAIDLNSLLHLQVNESDTEGTPEYLTFTSLTAGVVHPTPDVNYTLKFEWWARLTTFTAGTASPDGVTFSIPDHFFRQALLYGAPALLQHHEVEHAFGSSSWRKYEEYRESVKRTAGLLPARLSQRRPITDTER